VCWLRIPWPRRSCAWLLLLPLLLLLLLGCAMDCLACSRYRRLLLCLLLLLLHWDAQRCGGGCRGATG
jgi:hypothetical protein